MGGLANEALREEKEIVTRRGNFVLALSSGKNRLAKRQRSEERSDRPGKEGVCYLRKRYWNKRSIVKVKSWRGENDKCEHASCAPNGGKKGGGYRITFRTCARP